MNKEVNTAEALCWCAMSNKRGGKERSDFGATFVPVKRRLVLILDALNA